MRFQISLAALLLAAMTVLAACAETPEDQPPDAPTEDPDAPADDQALRPADIAGTWGDEHTDNTPYLNFTSDDEVVGSDGCNALRGTYTLEDGTAEIELGMSTLKGCVGVDTWLRDVASVQPDGDTLQVYDHSGEQIGTLDRAGS